MLQGIFGASQWHLGKRSELQSEMGTLSFDTRGDFVLSASRPPSRRTLGLGSARLSPGGRRSGKAQGPGRTLGLGSAPGKAQWEGAGPRHLSCAASILRALGGRRCPRGSAERTLCAQRRASAVYIRAPGLGALQGPCSFSLKDREPVFSLSRENVLCKNSNCILRFN